jgi:catechol 2,3-dioxygenase-like lactoylglutathione lyase family enzyme
MSFTVTDVHHVGITVSDVQRSADWYARMFGVTAGPVHHGEGAALSAALQVPGTVLSFAMVQIGATRIEFLQYHEPPGSAYDRTNGDVGSAHVCFQVDDLDAAYRTLQERGAVFNAPPNRIDDGELAGSRWAYLRDPDGIQLEIWESPAG